jgi:hypothetical protein
MPNPPFLVNFRTDAGRLALHARPIPPETPVLILRQIQCAERELRRRRRWYANRIVAGRMTVAEAASELWEMEGIVHTLRDVGGCPTDSTPGAYQPMEESLGA